MEAVGGACDKVWAVNPHAPDSLDWVSKLIRKRIYDTIDVTPDLLEFGRNRFGFEEYLTVSPDEGGQERFSIAGFGKRRQDSFSVELHGDLDVRGRSVIVLDDLTKSGSTLLKAMARLKEQGAREVGLAVVHVLPLVDKGEELLEKLFQRSNGMIVTSNTIRTRLFCDRNPANVYNVVDTLVKAL
jgi:phosphoribosylpyrophosphate synthetase